MRMNLPNVLTVLRVAVIPIVLLLFYWPFEHARQLALVLYAAACITDWVDGYLARKLGQTSKFGAFLDPVADKLLVTVTLVMLLEAEVSDGQGRILAVLVAIIIGREVTVSALREWMAELGQRTSVAVGMVGKLKTTVQMVAIGCMIWKIPTFGVHWYTLGFYLLFAAAALTVWSMLLYLKAAWPFMKEDHPLGKD